jgi:hypothetical protein
LKNYDKSKTICIFNQVRVQNFIIKANQQDTIYSKHNLFCINKGMNSGNPPKERFTHSFVVIFEVEQNCENLYFVAYSLWKTNFWHQHLVGCVIPFLCIHDLKKGFL